MSWLLLGGMLVLVAANGFFVAAEFASSASGDRGSRRRGPTLRERSSHCGH